MIVRRAAVLGTLYVWAYLVTKLRATKTAHVPICRSVSQQTIRHSG